MNRRLFLTKLAVGVVAAPAIVKALAHEDPYRCVIKPVTKEYRLCSSARTVPSCEEDIRRAYAQAVSKQMQRARERFIDQILEARAKSC